ncbi:MAG: BLUF domain-containing protein [Alphaproteobacteria bacterium]
MNYLIYASQAARPMRSEDLADLLESSRKRNGENEITGLLIYKASLSGDDHGYFMQLLEGPSSALAATRTRIEADPRHRNMVVFEEGDSEARSFGDWSMAFRHVDQDDLAAMEGFADLGSPTFWSRARSGDLPDALDMMRWFAKEDV